MAVDFSKAPKMPKKISFIGHTPNEMYVNPEVGGRYYEDSWYHRYNYRNKEWTRLRQSLEGFLEKEIAENGAIQVNSNMESGASTVWAQAIVNVKKRHPKGTVKFVANLSSNQQIDKLPTKGKKYYQNLLNYADVVEVAGNEDNNETKDIRNMTMLRGSSQVISFWRLVDSETARVTLEAFNNDIPISFINPEKLGFLSNDENDVRFIDSNLEEIFYTDKIYQAINKERRRRQAQPNKPKRRVLYEQGKILPMPEEKSLEEQLRPYMRKKTLDAFLSQHKKLWDGNSEADPNKDRTIEAIKLLNMLGIEYSLRKLDLKHGTISVVLNNNESAWYTIAVKDDEKKDKYFREYNIGTYRGALDIFYNRNGVIHGQAGLINDLLILEDKNPREILANNHSKNPKENERILFANLSDKHKRFIIGLPLIIGTGRTLKEAQIDDVKVELIKKNKITYYRPVFMENGNRVYISVDGMKTTEPQNVDIDYSKDNILTHVFVDREFAKTLFSSENIKYQSFNEVYSFSNVDVGDGNLERYVIEKFAQARLNYINALYYEDNSSEQFVTLKEKFEGRIKNLNDYSYSEELGLADAIVAGLKNYSISLTTENLKFSEVNKENPTGFENLVAHNSKGEELYDNQAIEYSKLKAVQAAIDVIDNRYEAIKDEITQESVNIRKSIVTKDLIGIINDMDSYLGDGYNKINVFNTARLSSEENYLKNEKRLTEAIAKSGMKDYAVATGAWNERKLAQRMLQFDAKTAISSSIIDNLVINPKYQNLEIDANGYGLVNGKVWDFKKYPDLTEVDKKLYDTNSLRSVKNIHTIFENVKEELANNNVYPIPASNSSNTTRVKSMVYLDANGILHWQGQRVLGDVRGREVKTSKGDIGQVFVQDNRGLLHVEESGHGVGENVTFVPMLEAHLVDSDSSTATLGETVRVRKYNDYLSAHLRQTLRHQLVRSDKEDLSLFEETYDITPLYHGENSLLTKIPAEDLVATPGMPQEVIDAKIKQLLLKVRLPKMLKDEMGIRGMYQDHTSVIENTKNYLNYKLGESLNELKIKNGEITDEDRVNTLRKVNKEFVALSEEERRDIVATYTMKHGGVSVVDIADETNKGYFSRTFTHNGNSLGMYRYLESPDQVQSDGSIKPVIDEKGDIREVVTPMEKALPEASQYFGLNPSDRKVIVAHQLLEAHGIYDNVKVMMANVGGLTDEDAGIISKQYADSHGIPLNVEREQKEHEIIFESNGRLVDAKKLLGREFVRYSSKGNPIRYKLAMVNESGLPVDTDEVNSDLNVKQADLRLIKLKKDGSFYKLNNTSVVKLTAGMKDFQFVNEGNLKKVSIYEKDKYGKLIKDASEQPTTRPIRVGDKISDSSGNKMTVAAVIDADYVNDNPQTFEERQKLRLATVFKGSGADVIANPYTPLSRKNMGQLAQLRDNYKGSSDTISYIDPITNKKVDLHAQVSEMTMITTHKTSLGDSTIQGRSYSQQMAWADAEREAFGVLNEVYANNIYDLYETQQHLLTAGYALLGSFSKNNIRIAHSQSAGDKSITSVEDLVGKDVIERAVNAHLFGKGYDTVLGNSVMANKQGKIIPKIPRKFQYNKLDTLLNVDNKFNEKFRSLTGPTNYVSLPVSFELASGESTKNLFIADARLRKPRTNENGEVVSSEYTNGYREILKHSARYLFYRKEKELLSHDSVVFPEVTTSDGERLSSKEVKENYLTELDKEIVRARDNIQHRTNELSSFVANKYLGMNDQTAKKGDFRQKLMSQNMKDGVTSVMTNGSLECGLDEIILSERQVKHFNQKKLAVGKDGYLYFRDSLNTEHPEKAMVHVDRQPVWHSTGTLGFYVKVDPTIDGAKMNPAFVGSLDGDFDGDNIGVIPLYSREAQKDLREKLSVANNLVNIGTDENNPDLNISFGGGWLKGAINSGLIASLDEKYRLEYKGKRKVERSPKAALNAYYKDIILNGGKVSFNGKEETLLPYNAQKAGYSSDEEQKSRKTLLKWLEGQQRYCLESSFEHSGLRVDSLANSTKDLAEAVDLGLKGKKKDLAEAVGYATGKSFDSLDSEEYQAKLLACSRKTGMSVEEVEKKFTEKFMKDNSLTKQDLDKIQSTGVYFNGKDFDYQSKYSEVNLANGGKTENTGFPGKQEQKIVAALRGRGGLKEALEIMYPLMQANLQVKHKAEDAIRLTEMFQKQIQLLMKGKATNPRVIFDKVDLTNPQSRYSDEMKFGMFSLTEEKLDEMVKKYKDKDNIPDGIKAVNDICKENMEKYYPKFYKDDATVLTVPVFINRYKQIMDYCNVEVDDKGLERMAVYLAGYNPDKKDNPSFDNMVIQKVDDLIKKQATPMDYVALKGHGAVKYLAEVEADRVKPEEARLKANLNIISLETVDTEVPATETNKTETNKTHNFYLNFSESNLSARFKPIVDKKFESSPSAYRAFKEMYAYVQNPQSEVAKEYEEQVINTNKQRVRNLITNLKQKVTEAKTKVVEPRNPQIEQGNAYDAFEF